MVDDSPLRAAFLAVYALNETLVLQAARAKPVAAE
jgi:hypothetical protein